MLWVALWGAGLVQRYDPQTGRALAECVAVSQCKASRCCLGRRDGRTLYITTAQSDGQAVGLYACRVEVSGPLPYAWRGQY